MAISARTCWLFVLGLGCLPLVGLAGDPDSRQAKRLETTRQLNVLIDDEWDWRLREQPTFAAYLGDRRHNSRWPDVSLKAINRRHGHRRAVLKQLAAIDRNMLANRDRLNYDQIRRQTAVSDERHCGRPRWWETCL